MESTLINILKIEALEIKTSFEKASIEGQGTPQEVADRREKTLVKSFLEKYFPFPYRITKGNITDSYGTRSNSIDCIVLNPSHPYTIDPKNDSASIIFADAVDCVIEVKPDLANKIEIERGLKQIRSVKKLKRIRQVLLFENKYTKEEIENSKHIPTFIFADKTYINIKNLITYIVDYYVVNNIPKDEQFDFIVINNRAILFNARKNSYISFGDYEGIIYSETKENTLALFLLYMNKMPKSQPEINENIIEIYLKDATQDDLKKFEDLNIKLRSIN